MRVSETYFMDRHDGGRQLAKALEGRNLKDPIVLALPRGGVPVAYEIARVLHAPLDLLMVRKIGAPGHPEYGIGGVVDGENPQLVLNDEIVQALQPDERYLAAEMHRQLHEIERRRQAYLGGRKPLPVRGRTVVLVDDGIATGGTMRVAIRALRKAGAERIVVAVPVAPRDTIDRIGKEADDVVCLSMPEPFHAVGLHYRDFDQTSDAEVVQLLDRARAVRMNVSETS